MLKAKPSDFQVKPIDLKIKKRVEDDKRVKERDVFGSESKPKPLKKKKSKSKK
jgi:hypothetical protein